MWNLKVWDYNSSWRLRIFSLSHNKMKNIFLYFLPSSKLTKLTIFLILFTKQKDCYKDDSTSSLKNDCYFAQTKKTWVVISLINWKVSIKVGYQQSTAACKTSYHCCLFSLWAGFHVWVLPHGTASYYTNRCHLWKNLLKLL